MKTTYHHAFNQSEGIGRTPQQAFNGMIRQGYKGEFDSWRKSHAGEAELKVIADACRSMRVMMPSNKSLTSYGDQFVKYEGHTPQKSSVDPLAAQVSKVPLGTLARGLTSQERALKEERHRLHHAQIAAARRVENDISGGKALTLEARNKARMTVNFSQITQPAEATMKPGEDQGAPAGTNTWKSLNRASWVGDVHSKTAVSRFELKSLKKGEWDDKANKQQNILHSLSKHAAETGECLKTLGGSKNGGLWCVSNQHDDTGEKISRFSFAKFV